MTTNELRDLLDEASAGVPDSDFTHLAWEQARRGQVHRRTVLGGSLAACVGLGLGAFAARDLLARPAPGPTQAPPAGTSTRPTAAAWKQWTTRLPPPSGIGGLAAYEGSFPLRDLRLGDATRFSTTAGFAAGERLVAAWTQPEERRVGVITSAGRRLLLDDLALADTSDSQGNVFFGLSPAAIEPVVGRFLVIAQPNRVVIVDAELTGDARPWRHVVIDDAYLERADVTDLGTRVVAMSADSAFAVDLSDDTVSTLHRPTGQLPGFTVDSASAAATGIAYWQGTRVTNVALPAGMPLLHPWGWGPVVSRGRIADLADIPEVERETGAYQIVVSVVFDAGQMDRPHPTYRLLAEAAEVSGRLERSKGGIRALAYAADGSLIVQADGVGGYATDADTGSEATQSTRAVSDLLAWDLGTGALTHVGILTPGYRLVVRDGL